MPGCWDGLADDLVISSGLADARNPRLSGAAYVVFGPRVGPALPRFRRGDSNADGATDISDAVAILSYLFLGVKKVPCEQAGDANDDGSLDISDAVYVLGFLFLGGKPIEPPVEECGVDPTGHALLCGSFPGCD
jgi:hypothetical protein